MFLVSGIDEVKAHSNFAEILVFKSAANTLVFRVQSATKPKPKKTNLAKGFKKLSVVVHESMDPKRLIKKLPKLWHSFDKNLE